MNLEQIYYLQYLASHAELSGKEKRTILERLPEAGDFLRAPRERLKEILSEKQAESVWRKKQGMSLSFLQEEYGKLGKMGISFVAFGQEGYPKRLSEIPDPPLGIYYKGRLPEENGPAVAVIGSRDCSEYGKYVASSLGRFLGEREIPVISGMARGIDGISQQTALEAGGESYGVLGCGVDVCYPKSNERLYQTLMRQGGILSEYPPGTAPVPYNFPPRNRIVSGLSMAVVVVEAAIKSGTSITVSMALEQGRDVFVVPGRVTDRLSDGCNRLIKQGASVFTDPESFLEELQETWFLQCVSPAKAGDKAPNRRSTPKEPNLSPEQKKILEKLDHAPKTVEEVKKSLGEPISIQELTIRLMELVLSGKAKQVSPGHFCKG